ncbi:GAF domain-containing protein [Duganella sp. FT80W]|uniref:GAF domain-containing protein n=1 Tax=Duganella guangzhouensis TaxID=2666084 RepID=A0A6I2L971_9BURK|nr:cache domain-containing protein [Duganella guangzhouensis]MRW94825.1 GAF domain-containing protein [Duganella guangzhouensis]
MTSSIAIVTRSLLLGWSLALASAVVAATLMGCWSQASRERDRLDLLENSLQRHAIEARSLTLDGNLMGAISLLGLIEPAIKQESQGTIRPNTKDVLSLLESVADAYHAQSVFVVDREGNVSSSWDNGGTLATGLEVGFRPYFKTAMSGSDSVYAAVSLSHNARTLYFAAPVFLGQLRSGEPVGAVVARTGMERIDNLLTRTGKTALLISPQGVVFASTRKDWQAQLVGAVTQERIQDIRARRQFGNYFESRTPHSLSFDIGTGISVVDGVPHAIASTPISWNDPAGVWQMVLIEDLSKTAPPAVAIRDGLTVGAATLFIASLLLRLLRTQAAQREAAQKMEQMIREQAAQAESKMQLVKAALRMQQADGHEALARTFLSECHLQFGAMQGVLYTVTNDGAPLRLAGSFADARPPATITPGTGLLGECARERRARVIDTEAVGCSWTICSGLGESQPAALLLAPVMLQSRLLGVVELAVPHKPDVQVLEQFTAFAEVLAINMGLARHAVANTVPS